VWLLVELHCTTGWAAWEASLTFIVLSRMLDNRYIATEVDWWAVGNITTVFRILFAIVHNT